MEIVRKELNPDELYPSNLRYNEATDTVEVSNDGTTWTPAPQSDPRNIRTQAPRGGPDPRCDTAANLTENLHEYIDANIAALNAGAGVAALISLFFERLPFGFTLLIALIEGLIGVIMALGAADLAAKFTTAVYDRLQCLFYCAMDADGILTETALQGVLAEVYATEDVSVYNVLAALALTTGAGGFFDWGTIGDVEGDCTACTDCGWCYVFDFTLGQHGFTIQQGTNPVAPFGIWTADGFKCADAQNAYYSRRALHVGRTFPSSVVTYMKLEFDYTTGYFDTNAPGAWTRFWIHDGGGDIVLDSTDPIPASPWEWTGSRTMDDLFIWLTCSAYEDAHGSLSGAGMVTKLTLRGEGENPFGEDNC